MARGPNLLLTALLRAGDDLLGREEITACTGNTVKTGGSGACAGTQGGPQGDLKIALRGGGGGGYMDARRRREGGGGLEKWGSVSGPLFCVRTDVGAKGAGTQNLARKFLSTDNFTPPHLSSQNDQRDVGIILSHRCWVDPRPPGTAGRAPLP